jgi:hypothetical protein
LKIASGLGIIIAGDIDVTLISACLITDKVSLLLFSSSLSRKFPGFHRVNPVKIVAQVRLII